MTPTLRPEPRPLDRAGDDAVRTDHLAGGTVIELDSLAVDEVLERLAEAPAPPRAALSTPRRPRPTAVGSLLAAVAAPAAWVAAVQLVPLGETASGATIAAGWVAMGAIAQRWATRTRRPIR